MDYKEKYKELIEWIELLSHSALTEDQHKIVDMILDKCYSTGYRPAEDDHWQDVRERAAIAAMQGVMNFFGSIDYNKETIAKLAVEQADALIAILKEESK